jgi:O-Antigen ligase
MKEIKTNYALMILLHIGVSFLVYLFPILSVAYSLISLLGGIYIIVKSKNSNNEVLQVSAYLVGVEVFLRMTGGNFINEFIKFAIIFFMILGFYFSSFSKKAVVFFIFLILLFPGVYVSIVSSSISNTLKADLFFNLTGPVCLGIASIYCYDRKITLLQLQNIVRTLIYPITAMLTYLFLYNPSVRDVITGTQSNFETSGGFGPNQVSTILGLGMFACFSQIILFSKSKLHVIINIVLLLLMTYRGIVTFSRGGIICGLVIILMLLFALYRHSNSNGKIKINIIIIMTVFFRGAIWIYSVVETNGLIEKRYANKDAVGRIKTDRLGGREILMETELKMFYDNPFFGVGVGKGKEIRKQIIGTNVPTHSEITRMLAEHGLFGILGLCILFFVPFLLHNSNKQHLYFLSFFFFWLLTINHAAIRTAAPAFIYALSLLKVTISPSKNVAIEKAL